MIHSLIILLCFFVISHCKPCRTCPEQKPCLDIKMKELDGGKAYKVCVTFDSSLKNCNKDGSISHVCPTHNKRDKIQGWREGDNNKMCKTVKCGDEASFGIKDGKGCRKTESMLGLTINGITDIRCEYTEGYCGGGNKEDCTWTIPAPQCATEPECGGIAGIPCKEGFYCVDDPNDGCDPDNGGRDCGGICVQPGDKCDFCIKPMCACSICPDGENTSGCCGDCEYQKGKTELECLYTGSTSCPVDETCPTKQPSPGDTCNWEGKCCYGEETCCGETFDSFCCSCFDGEAACYHTDACLGAPEKCEPDCSKIGCLLLICQPDEELVTPDGECCPVCKKKGCCDPLKRPGNNGNPICIEGHACCADGTWPCSIGDGTTFPCGGVSVNMVDNPEAFGKECINCCDPATGPPSNPICREGCACCPDGTWSGSIGDARTYNCGGSPCIEDGMQTCGGTVCKPDCITVLCEVVLCPPDEEPVIPDGECCPVCKKKDVGDCPSEQFSGGTCDWEGKCCWGQETCCGKTFDSFCCSCFDGQPACLFTDACLGANCEPDCRTVLCPERRCEPGQELVTPEGECCPVCKEPDCSKIGCLLLICQPDEEPVIPDHECCAVCKKKDIGACPAAQTSPGDTCNWEGTCCYGAETCCGETFDSFCCMCLNGEAGCYHTDACLGAPANCGTTQQPIPLCIPPGATFKGDNDFCAVARFVCDEGYTYWSLPDCGCGCRPQCHVPDDGYFLDFKENCGYKTCKDGYYRVDNDCGCLCLCETITKGAQININPINDNDGLSNNKWHDGLSDMQFLLLNVTVSVITCLLVIAGCLTCCYLLKKCNGPKYQIVKDEDVDSKI